MLVPTLWEERTQLALIRFFSTVVKQMSKLLKRRTSVNHLYQAACLVINPSNQAAYEQMTEVTLLRNYVVLLHSFVYDLSVQDWRNVDVQKIMEECGSKVCSTEEIKAGCCNPRLCSDREYY